MSNLFGSFFVLYMLFFVVHGSIYSNTMQSIRLLKKSFKTKGVNGKTVRAQINKKLTKIKWMRRGIWVVFASLFLLHLKFIGDIIVKKEDVYRNAIYLFAGVCVLLFLMNWIKGTKTIDEKNSF